MKNKIILITLFSLLIPVYSIFAVSINPYAPLGSEFNPINTRPSGSSGFVNPYAPLGSEFNPIYIQKDSSIDKIQDFQNSAGSSVPQGYQCEYSQFIKNKDVVLKKIEAEIEKIGKNPNASKLYIASLYVSKGQMTGTIGAYYNDCKNIDSTIKRFATSWNDQVNQISDMVCKKSSGINSIYTGETDINKNGGIGGCGCKPGYQFEYGNYGQCVAMLIKSNDQICQNNYGLDSNWNGTKNDTGGLICDCKTGYEWNQERTACIKSINCQENATNINGICTCNYGTLLKNNKCISYTEDCRNIFGENVVGTVGPNNNSSCDCVSGYKWNEQITSCILVPVIPTKTNEQICTDDDSNSFFYGGFDGNGYPLCGCKAGYERVNSENDKCTPIPKKELEVITSIVEAEVEVVVPVDQKEPVVEKAQDEVKENISDNTNLASINSAKQTAISSTEKAEPKSLWVKIKSWFSFWN